MGQTKFFYKSVLESEGQAYTDVKKVLQEAKIPARAMHKIMLAISEAFTNALIHGNKYNPEKTIEIRLSVNNKAVTADVIDEGLCDMKALSNGKSPTSSDEGGRGIDLIEKMADEFEVRKNNRTGGMQVWMKFYGSRYEDIKDPYVYRR